MYEWCGLQAEEEEARQFAERERRRKEREAAKQRRKEQLGDDYVSEDEKDEEGGEGEGEGGEEGGEEGGGEDQAVEEKPKGPSPILSALFTSEEEGVFWVSMVSQLLSLSLSLSFPNTLKVHTYNKRATEN